MRTADRAWPLALGLVLLVIIAVRPAASAICSHDVLVLENVTIDDIEIFRACLTITAGPGVTVSATGAATFQAGERIVLRPGFRVQAGGRLVARIGAGTSTGPLNDTGIDWCADDFDNNHRPCPVIGFPGQDGEHGRDALARAGQLPKVGGGAAGFDFTKLDADGYDPPASAAQWNCVRDNHTGLIWEVKVDDPNHLRHRNHTYTWYDPNSPDGHPGVANGGACTGSTCDTTGFVQAVNQQGLCGASDWRMPTAKELDGIVDYGRFDPAIDTGYFPNTPSSVFWSASPYAGSSDDAWYAPFTGMQHAFHNHRSRYFQVRLVRSGP